MKRIAIVFAVISVLLLADGLYMVLANYHPADANTFFGNQNWNLSDGEVTLISAGFFILATALLWTLLWVFRPSSHPSRQAKEAHEQADRHGSRTAPKE